MVVLCFRPSAVCLSTFNVLVWAAEASVYCCHRVTSLACSLLIQQDVTVSELYLFSQFLRAWPVLLHGDSESFNGNNNKKNFVKMKGLLVILFSRGIFLYWLHKVIYNPWLHTS